MATEVWVLLYCSEFVREMARCLREISVGRVPK